MSHINKIIENTSLSCAGRNKKRGKSMSGKLRNMTAIYLFKGDKVLLLFRQGGSVVNNVWTGSAGGHFEEFELNDAKATHESGVEFMELPES